MRIHSLLQPQEAEPEHVEAPEELRLTPSWLRKADVFRAVLLLVLAAALWAPRLRAPIDLRHDAAVNYLLGTSIAEGKGYRLLNEPGEIKAVRQPPLLPAFVALHQKIAGTGDVSVVGQRLRVSFGVIFLLYVLASYVMARQFVTPGLSLMIGLVCCLFHYGLFLADLLAPEIPFALAATVLVIFTCRANTAAAEGGGGRAGRIIRFTGAAVCAVAAYLLILPAGLALLAAWVGEALFRGRWVQLALRAAVAVVPVLAWEAYVGHVTASAGYQQPAYAYQRAPYQYYNVAYLENVRLADPSAGDAHPATGPQLQDRALRNLREVPPALGQAVTAHDEFWKLPIAKVRERSPESWLRPEMVVIPTSLVGMIALCGAFVLMKRREWFTPVYVTASVAVVCLAPWPGEFGRAFSTLTPFLALCLAVFLSAVYARVRGRGERALTAEGAEGWWFFGRAVVAVSALAIVGIAGFATGLTYWKQIQAARAAGGKDAYYRLSYHDENWDAFDAAAAWLAAERASEPAEAAPGLIATSAPHRAYLKTGGLRKAIMPPMEADAAKSQELLDAASVTYLIVDELGVSNIVGRFARPAVEKHPDLWERVHTVPGTDTHVYRRSETAAPGPADAAARAAGERMEPGAPAGS